MKRHGHDNRTAAYYARLALLAVAALTSNTQADPVLYATGEGGTKLVTIDIASGEVTTVGSFGVAGAMGIAFAPNGTAYSVTESCGSCGGIPRVVTIDRSSGKLTVIAPTAPRIKFMGIVCSPQGILYGVDAASGGGSGSLFTIDPATGNVSRVGAPGAAGSIMDLAFHPNGTLYGIEGTRLYTVDPTTGARTLAKQLKGVTDSAMGLAIDDDGTFYAAENTSPSPIVRIDMDTGQATPVVRTKINLIHGLDIRPALKPILYATAGAGKSLVEIDVAKRQVIALGDFGLPGADAVAINSQGQAFTVTHGWPPGGDSQLARVDLATGQATAFGANLKPENFMGLGFAPDGALYGVNAGSGTADAGSLYKFNLATGAATKVGVTGGCFGIMDLAWAPDGAMYGAVNDSLYRVDSDTGQATLVTKLQGVSKVMGLAIDACRSLLRFRDRI